ncbi:MAG: flagellar basal body-associated FliL family protein [Eubacteriales bacterium]
MPNGSESGKAQNARQKKPKDKSKKLLLIILILVVLAGSAGAFLYFKNPALRGTAKVEKQVELETLDMGEMVVNLAANGGAHYLRLKIIIEYPKEKKLAEEIKKKKHQIADGIIVALRNKSYNEIASAGSIEGLKKSLLDEINSRLEKGKVEGIFFTDYLVQ